MIAHASVGSQRLDLLRELVVRDVRLRYRGKALGLLWSQLSPIVSVLVLSVVFSRLIPLDIPNYPVFLFIGIEAWQWFQGGVATGTASVLTNRDLVRQPGFPIAVLPPLAVATNLAYFVLALPVVLGSILVTTGRIPVTVLWVPVIISVQFLLSTGCAYVLSVLHVRWRDTSDVVGVVLRMAMFLTPVIYDESRLRGSRFHLLFDVNPMAYIVTAMRNVMLEGKAPAVGPLAIVALGSLGLVAVGRWFFGTAQASFADEV